ESTTAGSYNIYNHTAGYDETVTEGTLGAFSYLFGDYIYDYMYDGSKIMYLYSVSDQEYAAGIKSNWRLLGYQELVSHAYTSKNSVINSGRDLTINATGTVTNTSSVISAARDVNITANRIDNSRGNLGSVEIFDFYIRNKCDPDNHSELRLYNADRDFYYLSTDGLYLGNTQTFFYGREVSMGSDYGIDWYTTFLSNYVETRKDRENVLVLSSTPSKIIAGRNLSLHQNQFLGTDHGQSRTNPGQFIVDVDGGVNQSVAVNIQKSQLNSNLNGLGSPRDLQLSANINVDGVLFRYASGAGYLIESNPLFTDLNGLMSSAYFVERAGYNMDQFNSLFLGDAYWEKEYIAKQIEGDFNRRFIIDDIDSDALQREILFTNALDVSGELKLKVGVGLTESQRKSLKKPIAWYVEQNRTVNGQKVKVLVPVVYSPLNSTFDVELAGGVLSAKNIDIVASSDVESAGLIYADNLSSIRSNSLSLNKATLISDKLNVKVDKDINIKTSKLTTTGSAILEAGNNINIEGESTAYRGMEVSPDRTFIRSEGTKYTGSKINIGGDLIARANNLVVIGSDINVDGSAGFDIKNDMTLASATENYEQVSNKHIYGSWSDTKIADTHTTTVQKASNLNVGKQLNISTGNNLNLLASNISANDVYVKAKGDVNLVSGLNETTDEHSEVKSGMLSKKIDEVTDYKGVNVGSNIKANNTNYIKADGNINLLASELASDSGTVALEATDINLLSANDVNGHSEYHKTISYLSLSSIFGSLGSFITGGDLEFGSFKEDTKVSSEEIAKGSSIRGPTILIKTTNDFNSVGSNIFGQDVGLDIGRDLNLLSAEQQADYFSDSKEGKLYLNWDLAGISGVSLKAGVKYTEQKESTKTTTNVGSSISADNLQIKTGRDMTMMGSNIITNNSDIDVTGTFKALDVQDKVEHNLENLDVRTGVELRLTSNPLSVVEGIAGLGQTLASGKMFSGINGAFGSFNDTLTNFGKINQGYDTGSDGHMSLMGGSTSLNLFMDVNKHTENTNTSTSVGSSITANNELKLTTGNDLLLYGSNINAGKADINVGNNLDIRSSFDTSKNDSSDVS
ncbi:MAG TPA: hemagglutinin repeat-containing protein, partial [bacterium]|nr:hemagglutinin repeat-containing protein [bacterium]